MMSNTIPPCKIPDAGTQSATEAYVSELINEPWAQDGQHCWALVLRVQRDLFGRFLPVVLDVAPVGHKGRALKSQLFASHPERAHWREITEPEHGAVALMRERGSAPGMIVHAGVYLALDGGVVLHTDNPHGVVLDPIPVLRELRGWEPMFLVPV